MGKKIFISYGDARYRKSLQRLGKNAKELNLFDEIILYTEEDLPQELRDHELMQYKRGGGYWLWKPWVVLHTLEKMGDEDILIYSDSGNELYADKEWTKWFRLIDKYNGIFFCYAAFMERRCRKNLLEFYENVPHLKKLYQIQSGQLLVKGKARKVIQEWYDVMFQHPEFVIDVAKDEIKEESSMFLEHRHDQAVLSCAVYGNEKDLNLKVLWNHSEGVFREGQAVRNARISDSESIVHKYEPMWKWLARRLIVQPIRCMRNKILRIHLK